MPSSQTTLALAEIYETTFGLCNHGDEVVRSQQPLALVSLHPKEDTSTYSPLYRRISEFHALKIAEGFGLSLLEFLNLPRDYVELILQLARRDAAVTGKEANKALEALKNGAQP